MIPRFRAWDKKNEAMLHKVRISTYIEETMIEIANQWHWLERSFSDVTLMQSTGLIDVNGVEIYEGDIVKIDDYFNGKMKAKVVFELGAFGFVGIDKRIVDVIPDSWNDDFLTMAYFNWIYDHYEGHLVNVLKIGTVYENPELLEVSK